jgi:hypothetical protein
VEQLKDEPGCRLPSNGRRWDRSRLLRAVHPAARTLQLANQLHIRTVQVKSVERSKLEAAIEAPWQGPMKGDPGARSTSTGWRLVSWAVAEALLAPSACCMPHGDEGPMPARACSRSVTIGPRDCRDRLGPCTVFRASAGNIPVARPEQFRSLAVDCLGGFRSVVPDGNHQRPSRASFRTQRHHGAPVMTRSA